MPSPSKTGRGLANAFGKAVGKAKKPAKPKRTRKPKRK
jgi:hypothetical protein